MSTGPMYDPTEDEPDEHGPLVPHVRAVPTLALTTHSPRPGVCVVAVGGELDLATCAQLETAIELVLGEPRVVLDLSDLTFLASRGLGVLLAAHRWADGRLHVVVGDSPVRRVLEISGAVELLQCHRSLDDALDA